MDKNGWSLLINKIQNMSFFGYGATYCDRLNQSVRKISLKPEVIIHENAIALPKMNCIYNRDGVLIDESDAVYVPRGGSIPESKLQQVMTKFGAYSPEQGAIPVDCKFVDIEVVYLGLIWPQFGHFLLDTMSRFYFREYSDDARFIILHMQSEKGLFDYGYMRFIAEKLAIRPEAVFTNSQPIRFRRVIIPLPSIHYSYEAHDVLPIPHELIAQSIEPASIDLRRPIYISRSRVQAERRVEGEDRLEAALENIGFRIVSPEALPLADQIRMFSDAPLIVGMWGSAFHNILFEVGDRERRRVMLCGPKIPPRYPLVDKLKPGHTSYYINVLEDTGLGTARVPKLTVDDRKVIQSLKNNNLT